MGTAPRSAPIRILLADDQPRALAPLAALLATFDDLALVGTATDGAETLRLVEERRPDVVIVDVGMAGGHGLDARRLKAAWPRLPVLVIAMSPSRLESAGGDAALLKGASGDEIAGALRRLVDQHAEPVQVSPAGPGGFLRSPRPPARR